MRPTLRSGQLVLAVRRSDYQVGDVVVAHTQGHDVIKRIEKLDENHVWLAGDNSEESVDSRHYGPLALGDVLGRVMVLGKDAQRPA